VLNGTVLLGAATPLNFFSRELLRLAYSTRKIDAQ